MIGLYPLSNFSNVAEPSNSATIATTLPNFPISTPSFTTPPYAFNTSVEASAGAIVLSELATSTYSAIFGTRRPSATALPAVSPAPSVVTFVTTDASGSVYTSVSTVTPPSIILGRPPGWNAGKPLDVPIYLAMTFG